MWLSINIFLRKMRKLIVSVCLYQEWNVLVNKGVCLTEIVNSSSL